MDKESISQKLSELFELYKSGALSKDEYDQLKSQIINSGERQQSKEAETSSESLPKVEAMSETSSDKNKVFEPSSTLVNDNQPQVSDKKRDKNNLDTKPKRTIIKNFIFFGFILMLITSAFFIIRSTNEKVKKQNSDVKNPVTETQGTVKPIDEKANIVSGKAIAEPIAEEAFKVWDESFAKKIIMEELSKHTDWSDINTDWIPNSTQDTTTMIHDVQFFPIIKFENKELMVGVAYSNFEGNDCKECWGALSVFEFENRGGWRLTKKCFSFDYSGGIGGIELYRISSDNYGILTSFGSATMGEINESETLHAFVNGKLIPVLSLSHMGNVEDNYSAKLKKSNKCDNNGYYYLLVEEEMKPENSEATVTRIFYAFNGSEYKEFNGSITDPALTSMDRFINVNSLLQENYDKNKTNKSEQSGQSDDDKYVRDYIISHYFEDNENGNEFTLKFSEKNGGWFGIMEFNYGSCTALYRYETKGRSISLTFDSSTCTSQGSSTTARFNSDNSLSLNIKGQEFQFKPI